MITRKFAVRTMLGGTLLGLATGALALAGPAAADTGSAACVSPDRVGPDGYAHIVVPATGQDIAVPACNTWSQWREVPTTAVQGATRAPQTEQRATTTRTRSTTRRATRQTCGTWWARGRDAKGRGGTRPGYRGTWHVVRECRTVRVG